MTDWLIRYRFAVIGALVLMTVPFLWNIPSIERDAGISALVPEEHPAYVFYNEMEDLFGATDQIVIGVNSRTSVFNAEVISMIQELTDFFMERDEIEEEDIISLTTIKDMKGTDGELIIEPFVDEDDLEFMSAESLGRLQNRVMSNPMYAGKIVSFDKRSAVVLVGVQQDITMNEDELTTLKQDTLDKLTELRERYPEISLDFSGPAMMKAYISEYMLKDLKTLFPIAVVVVALIIAIIIRSFVGTLVPVFVTLFAVVWTIGLKSLIGSPITIVETAIPVALIAIGCADGIHIISDFLAHFRRTNNAKEAAKLTMKVLTLPVVLTSVTTGLGFLSLLTAPGISIRNMGVFLAFGVLVAMIFSLLFIPVMLSFLRSKKNYRHSQSADKKFEDRAFEKKARLFAAWTIKHRKKITLIGMILLALSVLGIVNTEIESDEVRYLKRSNEFRKATEKISENLGGITSLDVVIASDEPDFFKRPEILQAMAKTQRFAEKEELVSYTLSICDLIQRLNYVLHDSQPEYDRLPHKTETVPLLDGSGEEHVDGKTLTAQYLFLYEISGGDSLSQMVDTNYQTAKISIRLKDMSSRKLEALLEKITDFCDTEFPPGTTIKFTNHYIRLVMMYLIIESQIYSLLTVLGTILILMSIIFRSPIVGLFTSLPVIIAVLFNFTIMWIFGVTLNIGTSIIASIGMGVGIDYAIHFYTRFRLFYREGLDYGEAAVKAVTHTSRAILTNATAVGIGFLVLLFSEYGVIAAVGWIVAVTMFTTALGSLVILPSLLVMFKPKIR